MRPRSIRRSAPRSDPRANDVALGLRYLGHRAGASLGYFTGASVDLVRGQVFDIPPEGRRVGRRTTASLRIASSQVSPHGALLTPCDDGLLLDDPMSTNPTQVNGRVERHAVLRRGDVVSFAGKFDFEVVRIDDP